VTPELSIWFRRVIGSPPRPELSITDDSSYRKPPVQSYLLGPLELSEAPRDQSYLLQMTRVIESYPGNYVSNSVCKHRKSYLLQMTRVIGSPPSRVIYWVHSSYQKPPETPELSITDDSSYRKLLRKLCF
jgi:hypothetical protein